jgi:HlyD family secretion protein
VPKSLQVKRWALIGLALAAIIIGFYYMTSFTGEKITGEFVADQGMPVAASPADGKLAHRTVRGRGELQAMETVDLVSTFAGKLTKLQVKAGDRVPRGQTLATVRSAELQQRAEKTSAALAAAKADLEQSEIQLAEAEKSWERMRELRYRELIAARDMSETEAELEKARARQTLARAQLAVQQASLEQVHYLLDASRLSAPLDGVVLRVWAEPGAEIQPSQPILSVGGLDLLKVTIEISKGDLEFVRQGAVTEIRADTLPDRLFEGQVIALQSTPQQVLAEIQLRNRARLLAPGMNVEVTVAQNLQ